MGHDSITPERANFLVSRLSRRTCKPSLTKTCFFSLFSFFLFFFSLTKACFFSLSFFLQIFVQSLFILRMQFRQITVLSTECYKRRCALSFVSRVFPCRVITLCVILHPVQMFFKNSRSHNNESFKDWEFRELEVSCFEFGCCRFLQIIIISSSIISSMYY